MNTSKKPLQNAPQSKMVPGPAVTAHCCRCELYATVLVLTDQIFVVDIFYKYNRKCF